MMLALCDAHHRGMNKNPGRGPGPAPAPDLPWFWALDHAHRQPGGNAGQATA